MLLRPIDHEDIEWLFKRRWDHGEFGEDEIFFTVGVEEAEEKGMLFPSGYTILKISSINFKKLQYSLTSHQATLIVPYICHLSNIF